MALVNYRLTEGQAWYFNITISEGDIVQFPEEWDVGSPYEPTDKPATVPVSHMRTALPSYFDRAGLYVGPSGAETEVKPEAKPAAKRQAKKPAEPEAEAETGPEAADLF